MTTPRVTRALKLRRELEKLEARRRDLDAKLAVLTGSLWAAGRFRKTWREAGRWSCQPPHG